MRYLSILLINLLLLGCAGCTPDNPSRSAHGSPAPALSSVTDRPLRILVVGGTSGVGLKTVELALARGHEVTAMARRPERMTLSHTRLNTIAGDILDARSTHNAVQGQDAVVIAIGMAPTRQPVTLFSAGANNVLQAMAAAGVSRLVAVTGIGAGDTRGHGGFFYDRILWPLALKTIYQDKDRQESLIRAAGKQHGINWTIVRPGFLTDSESTASYRVVERLEGFTAGSISRADVGHFIIAAIESGLYSGATPLISE